MTIPHRSPWRYTAYSIASSLASQVTETGRSCPRLSPPSSSCRAAHVQNEATAARLRLRVAGGLPGDLAEERPDRRRGQPGDLPVVVSCEHDQVAAVGADRVARLVRVARSARKSSM